MANESVSVDDLFQSLFPQEPADTGPAEQEAPAGQAAKLGGAPTPYDDLIYNLATARGQDPNLIKAQIWAESRFNPRAVSPKNARGLTQFIPGTYARFGKGDPFNPRNAIEAQLNYNEYLGNMFGGSVPHMLAAYNAGEGAVQKHGGIPPYRETQNYVNNILNKYAEYTGGAMPQGAAGQQAASAGVYELVLPNGGVLTVPEGMSQQEAIAEAAKEYPDLKQYLYPAEKAPEVKAPKEEKGALQTAAGSFLGGVGELGSSLAKTYAETGLPGAATAEEYAKSLQEAADKEGERPSQEEIDSAYKDSFLSGLATEAKAVGLHDIPHMIGRYGATLIPAGRALSVGKYMLEGLASFGDIQKRAEKEGVDANTWAAGAASAVSSLLANAGLPHVVANGVFSKVLGGASSKALEKAFEKGGVEEANKLLGSKIIDVVSGLGTATGAGFGVMAGTEAAQRAALGQPLQTPEELGQELRTAAWMSPLALPGALRAKGERGAYIDYLQQQEGLKQKAAELAAEERVTTPGAKLAEMDAEFPNLTKQVADEYRAAMREQEAPEVPTATEPPVGEAPKEAPKTEEVKTEEPGTVPVTFTAPEVPKAPEAIRANIEDLTKQAEAFQSANDFDNYNAAMRSIGQHETELRRQGAEELAVVKPAPAPAPKAEVPTPGAEPHFAESILGLQPVKDKRSLYQKLLQHDINTPEGREAITDLMHKTTARVEPEKAAALQKRMEELDAQQIPETGAPYGGSGPQPIIREEGRDQAVSGEGMEPSGQRIEAPEVSGEKVKVPEEKVDEFITRVAEMQRAKKKADDEALIRKVMEDEYAKGYAEGEPEELRFAKAEPVENPHTTETLQADLGKTYGRNAPRVEVSTREAEGVDESVRAFHDPATGRTVLIADNIGKSEDLHGLLRHEVGVHAQRLGRTDPEFQSILGRVKELHEQGVPDVVEAAGRIPEGTKPEHHAEEMLGYLVQHKPSLPVVQRFKSWLRRAMHKITGSTRWLSGSDFAAMADEVLRRAPKAAVREGERMFARRKSQEEKVLEEAKLTKVAPSPTEEVLDAGTKIVKNVIKTAMDSQMRDEVHATMAQKAVAQSAALARHVSPLETFSDWWGVRSDILRNQFDSLGHILTNGLRMGAPDISKGGMMKIEENPRLALHNWFTRSEKLPVTQKAAFDTLRVLIGEQWEKESANMRKQAKDFKAYAEVLAKSVDKVQGKERDKRRKMAADLLKEARNISKRAGEAPLEGLEKKVKPEHISAAHKLLERHPELKDWVDQTHEINRRAVDFLVKTDVLDTDTAKVWKARPYIALFKSLEDLRKEKEANLQLFEGSAKTLGTRKKIKGGTHEVNVPENMLRSWVQLYTTGYKNYVRKRAVQEMRMLGKVERTNASDPLAVLVKKAGKDEYWRVPDQATFEALKMTPFIHGVMSNLMAAPTGFVRSTLIKHPVFWARSITREPLTANFTSRTGFVAPHQVIGHLFKSLAGISKPKQTLETYGTSGVLESQLDPAKFSRAVTKAAGYEKIADYWNKVHSSFDTATRAAIFEAAKKEGAKYGLKDEMLDDFAAMKASEFANFATRGSSQLINEWGRMTPFFKASLNSLDNLYRNATGTHLNYREKQQAREMFRARAAGMAYMTALYTLAMLNDPDYRNAADSDWTMNYFIPTGREEGKWLPIASGFEPAVMFKMLPELLVRTYTGNLESQEAKGIATDVLQERFLPPMIPLLPALMSRVVFDYDINLGREIESPGAKRLPPELRDYNASAIGKMLSEKFEQGGLGVSPTKLDNLGKGILGGVYDMAITMADMYLAYKDPAQLFDKDIGQKYPTLKAFYTSSQNVQKAPVFYEAANSFQQAVNAINEAGNTGNVERLDKLMANPKLMKQYELATPLRKYRDSINELRQAIKTLRYMDMPAEEKEARAKDLTRIRHQYETEAALMAQEAMKEVE